MYYTSSSEAVGNMKGNNCQEKTVVYKTLQCKMILCIMVDCTKLIFFIVLKQVSQILNRQSEALKRGRNPDIIIHEGFTSTLQPPDVCINRPFKSHIHRSHSVTKTH